MKDLSLEKEHFIEIFLINKNQHKITINESLFGFMYENTIAPVSKEQLSMGNTFTNPVIILRKREFLNTA